MTKPSLTQVSVPFPCLLLALLALFLAGCEKGPPADRVEMPQTDRAAPQGAPAQAQGTLPIPAPCEEFTCADIGTLYARWIRVEENVGIGIPREHQVENALEVNGTILAEEVLVQANVADYVFAPGYDLKPLESVETYINEHHHLPGVPSALAVRSSGGKLGIGETYRVLLEKVEELTLYTIQQHKRIVALERLLAEQMEAKAPTQRLP